MFFLILLAAARFPLNHVPTLAFDGKIICQSAAIYRYLANEHNFYGSCNYERALVDQICETIDEIFNDVAPTIFMSQDSAEKKVYYIFIIIMIFLIFLIKIYYG